MKRSISPKFSYPPFLREGDKIAILAPASPAERPDAIETARAKLLEAGFVASVGKYAEKRNGFIAGSDAQRLRDLVVAFESPRVKAIWCVRGGYGTGRILSQLDPKLLARHPKLIIGCSDITALHCLAYRAKVVSFHAPMPNGLAVDGYPSYTWSRLLDALRGTFDPIRPLHEEFPDTADGLVIRKGVVRGRLFGGNLSILCSLLGTPYFPHINGCILYLEEIGEAPYRIDRMLTHLANAGVLKTVKGIALGTFKGCEYKPGQTTDLRQTLRDVLHERLSGLGIPVFYGLPFGHVVLNATIPNGALATLDATKGVLEL